MFLVFKVVDGIVVSARVMRQGVEDQPLEILNGKFRFEVNLGNSVEYEVLGEGTHLRLRRVLLQESDNDYPLTDGLNVFKDGQGKPAVFVDLEVLRGWLKAVRIPEDLIPLDYKYRQIEMLFGEILAGIAINNIFFQEGAGGRLKEIYRGGGEQKSDFLEALSRYLHCTLSEFLLALLQSDDSEENLQKAMGCLKDTAGITYKGLSEVGLSWVMLVDGEEKEYRPWVSRPGISSLYPLHLVCIKFGWRRVFQLLRGIEEKFTAREEQVLSLFESLESVEKAVDYLQNHFSPRALVMPDGEVQFSFGGQPFACLHDMKHGKLTPAQVGVLFRRHTGLTSLLKASLPSSQRHRGVACYSNHIGTVANDGILYFVDRAQRTPAFQISEFALFPADFLRQHRSKDDNLGIEPRVEAVVSADCYGIGHVLKSGEVVLNFSFKGGRRYLLLISRKIGEERSIGLFDLVVMTSVKFPNYFLEVSMHKGSYQILFGSVVDQ